MDINHGSSEYYWDLESRKHAQELRDSPPTIIDKYIILGSIMSDVIKFAIDADVLINPMAAKLLYQNATSADPCVLGLDGRFGHPFENLYFPPGQPRPRPIMSAMPLN
mgnify:CR=1 FL=1